MLFTTYSRNLATDIKENLQLICTQEELGRIDVLNLDRYVAGCLRKRGFDYQLTYDDVAIGEVWKAAIAESGQSQWSGEEAFLRDEWEEVIKNKGITTLGEYFRSSRRGRGSRMSRAHKASLWKVAEAYHRYMSDHKQWDVYQAMGMVEDSLRAGRITSPYAHIIVDEGQDFSAPAYRMLRAMVPEGTNDLLIVGDAQQRIYGKTVTLSQCGIAIQGRSRRLRINYRTTEQIRDAAERVFDTNGTDVSDEAFKAVLGESMQGDPERFDDLNGETVESNDRPGIRVATMHRVKGLEFDTIVVADINPDTVPPEGKLEETTDVVSRRELGKQYRSLIYVALTRARKEALMVGVK